VTLRLVRRRLRDATGIAPLSPSHFTETAGMLWRPGYVLHTLHHVPTWLCIVFRHCNNGKKTVTDSGDIISLGVSVSVNPVYQCLTARINEPQDFQFGILLTCKVYRLYSTTVGTVMMAKHCELIIW
jgi:hypothetical protein